MRTAPKILKLDPAETNPAYGTYPEKRSVEALLKNSIVVIDKPRGPTSHEIVAWAKKILDIEKAGHSGTLDPNVTGVLPVALDNGTRLIKQLLDIGKEYVCLMRLHAPVEEEKLMDAINLFVGDIYQRPPVKSAVKRQVRKRTIYEIEVLDSKDQFVLFRVSCQAGTYIRKLVYDIGIVLGCGANMAELRRTRVGTFTEKDMVTLQEISDAYHKWKENGDDSSLIPLLRPIESSVGHLPRIWLRDSAIDAICHGADTAIPGIVKFDSTITKNSKVSIMTLKDELVAVGIALLDVRSIQSKKNGLAAKTLRVVMDPGTYPRQWKGVNLQSNRKN